jgi:16S rRNA (cytidine1402-2'-O)-methyltransferase
VCGKGIPYPSRRPGGLRATAAPVHLRRFPTAAAGKRRGIFARLAALAHTVVFYESPHRLAASLADAAAAFGERPAVVARELTKLHEEVRRGTLSELAAALAGETVRGEVVVVIGPAAKDSAPATDLKGQ